MSAILRFQSFKNSNIVRKLLKVDHCDGWTLKLRLHPFARKLNPSASPDVHFTKPVWVPWMGSCCYRVNELSSNTKRVAFMATPNTYRILLEALSIVKAFFCICFSSGSIICFSSSKIAIGFCTVSLAPATMSLWTSKTRAKQKCTNGKDILVMIAEN